MGQAWYCIATTVKREKVASACLESADFDSLALETLEPRRYMESTRETKVPLFPGYIFVSGHLPFIQQQLTLWRQRHIPTGIHRMVGILDDPSPVEEEFIQSLRDRTDPASGLFQTDHMLRRTEKLWPDTPVRIMEGPWAGLVAKVARVNSKQRVTVLLEAFQRQVSIGLNRSEIEPILSKENVVQVGS